jgi:hypothetical protein
MEAVMLSFLPGKKSTSLPATSAAARGKINCKLLHGIMFCFVLHRCVVIFYNDIIFSLKKIFNGKNPDSSACSKTFPQ